jgi:hypothetical protein
MSGSLVNGIAGILNSGNLTAASNLDGAVAEAGPNPRHIIVLGGTFRYKAPFFAWILGHEFGHILHDETMGTLRLAIHNIRYEWSSSYHDAVEARADRYACSSTSGWSNPFAHGTGEWVKKRC